MKLDKEQKKILKTFLPTCLAYIIGYPFFLWVFGKLDSWTEVLPYLGIGLIVAIVLGVFYVLGSKIPKNDN